VQRRSAFDARDVRRATRAIEMMGKGNPPAALPHLRRENLLQAGGRFLLGAAPGRLMMIEALAAARRDQQPAGVGRKLFR
jgi:hypothetical protein